MMPKLPGTMLSSHLKHYFIPSDYARWARKALAACHMGNHSITEYIDYFLVAPYLLYRYLEIRG